ncbi:helix-turn-helix domain-containing protein [Spirosoma linguale]|uniref:Helix-turn-helix, AraC domain protein n=1 Tax=Spirosoma linguale (strain ATCC 33905 / DSM 74 / LMG 10896 / Claus 1) TaxID=504472 RepID=D2QFH2_SPILD|nr:Helix-turn-helix, AraC domain protein [Spirosoma linguale DSM 74]
MNRPLNYKLTKPDDSLAEFVYCFSSLQNLSASHEAVIIPNGKIDLMFSKTADDQLRISLLGLETKPKYARQDVSNFFSISFNPLAVEYIFRFPIADILDNGKLLPAGFWGFNPNDLNDFDTFCTKAFEKIYSLLPIDIDERKRKLFNLIQRTNGEGSIKEIAEAVSWSERQINRYFNQQFGLSLKAYCTILRFQASLPHIKGGTLFPQLNFTDQPHFIKEIRKLSGVSPKELFKNQNDRFLQFLVYDNP